MSVGSEEKIMCHTSARVHTIILITLILTDTRKSRNIQKNIVCLKIRIQHSPDNQDSLKKKCLLMKKRSKPFYNTCL